MKKGFDLAKVEKRYIKSTQAIFIEQSDQLAPTIFKIVNIFSIYYYTMYQKYAANVL